jgi:prevent-host-death family protein
MASTGVRELKANLTRFLETARRGEDVLVTRHGRAIARIVGESSRGGRSVAHVLEALEQEGADVPVPRRVRPHARPAAGRGKPTSAIVREQRR